MRTKARGLVVWTLAMCLGRVAVAQEPGPPPDEPPQTEEPQPVEVVPGPPGPQGQPGPPGAVPPVAGAPATPAAAGPGLGELGQVAISDDLQISALRDSLSITGLPTRSQTTIKLQPALDYFVAPNLSIGGQLIIGFESISQGSGPSTDTTEIGLLPRIGYVVAFSPATVLWPRVGLGYLHASISSATGTASSSTAYRVPLEVFVPVIFHPVPRFFVGGGLRVSTDLVSKLNDTDAYKTTEIGLVSVIGGVIGP